LRNAIVSVQRRILQIGESVTITCDTHYTVDGRENSSIKIYCQDTGNFARELKGPDIRIPYCITKRM